MADGSHNHGALAAIDRTAILERIAAGEYVPAIAADLGVSKQALSQAMQRWDKDVYLAARETAAELRLDDAMLELRAARDPVDLARAREVFRAVAWRAEREHPHRWGARPASAINIAGNDMQVQIVSYASNSSTDVPALEHDPDAEDA